MAREADDKYMTAEKAYTVCVVAAAAVIGEARRQACTFIRSECPHTKDTPEMMLPTALSPTGEAPATHYVCTRRMTAKEIERQAEAIKTYPVPVTANIVESEEAFLQKRALRKVS
jgi:hypothetical protein